ncbi:phosphate ABC transporter permease subunit PstC [Candidatus Bipolaricaulota bacterium]|nr:phosphate ABC transporter permease subunit PstC [Candidatus Bipolaricaulota bacterium]
MINDQLKEKISPRFLLASVVFISFSVLFTFFVLFQTFNVYLFLLVVAGVVIGWIFYEDSTAKALLFAASTSAGTILILIASFLFIRGLPAFQEDPIFFIIGSEWDVYGEVYSLGPMIWGSIIVTLGATALAAPLGVSSAIFIGKFAPKWLRGILKPAIELLAGIPSVVYGFLGFVLLNRAIMDYFDISNLGQYFAPSIILGFMALPTIASVAEDAIDAVPTHLEKGALALGVTKWQAIKEVTLPSASSGITAALILGIGRAMGETMAVTMMIGHKTAFPSPLYDIFEPGETLTSLIASQIGEASGQSIDALMGAGLLLFFVVLALSVTSRLIQSRLQRRFRQG